MALKFRLFLWLDRGKDRLKFSVVVFLLPCLGMLSAFIKSRLHDKTVVRPYKLPGGNAIAIAAGIVCIVVLSLTIALFVYTPGVGLHLPVLIGAAVMMGIGEYSLQSPNTAGLRIISLIKGCGLTG